MFYRHKFVHNSDSKLFLVSDTHFRHDKPFLYEKRGFKNIQEHDETLIRRWNETVRPQDHVLHLGDFILGAGQNSEKVAHEILGQLNGHIGILWGNHVAGISTIYKKLVQDLLKCDARDQIEVYPMKYNERITFLGNQCLAQVKTLTKTHFVFCSHFAHRVWIDGNKGILSASGHSHGSDKESNPDWPHHKRLDVGIENFGKPLDFDEFLSIMDSKSIQPVDHHDASVNPSF